MINMIITNIYPSGPAPDSVTESNNTAKNATEIINATTSITVLCIKVKNTYSEICFAVCAREGRDSQDEVSAKKNLFYCRRWNTQRELGKLRNGFEGRGH
jgi:hypothetical protein